MLEVDLRFEGKSLTNLLEKCATWFSPPLVGGHFLTKGGENLGISIDGLKVTKPDGAFYMFIRLTDDPWKSNDKGFVLKLLEEELLKLN